ncbi:MAG: NAD(P)H-hydrate dehydratase, partial [Gemmatimonadetes bacterium]|nr:NAD(P)H-hydrate dehydratase [Gemmatimonadota bacterium]
GLGAAAAAWNELPSLVDDTLVRAIVPPITANAHKGTRKRLVIVGGAAGMAGASILAARAAMRSGIGMTKLCVARESLEAVQAGEPAAMAAVWPESADEARALGEWAHAILIGPGLGRTSASFAVLEHVLRCFAGPVVLDADALSLFEGQTRQLATLLDGRAAVITPHEVEFSRLTGMSLDAVEAGRFEVAADLARALSCTVLLKGVPTVIADGTLTNVSAAGSPVLATAGSGDVLGGIVATLLAQTGQARESAAAGAWVHGRAAERAGGGRVRGATLDDVLGELRAVWSEVRPLDGPSAPDARPWLAELPAVGERG